MIQSIEITDNTQPNPYGDLGLDCKFLETTNLVLRPLHPEDAEDLASHANNFKVAGNLGRMPYPYFDADAVEFIERTRAEESTSIILAITHKENGAFMGMCGLHPADERYELPYIGYWLGEKFWNQGYATEASRALVDLYFKATAFDRMMITALRDNIGSIRVIEKCGGKLWKPSQMYSAAQGQHLPVNQYLITRESWLTTREC